MAEPNGTAFRNPLRRVELWRLFMLFFVVYVAFSLNFRLHLLFVPLPRPQLIFAVIFGPHLILVDESLCSTGYLTLSGFILFFVWLAIFSRPVRDFAVLVAVCLWLLPGLWLFSVNV